MKIRLSKCNLTDQELMVFNKPDIVYIPLISGNDTDITVLVNKGEHVYKGSIVGKRKGNFRIPIHSSISGTVLDFVEKTCFNGQNVKCVAIKNDFKEQYEENPVIKKKINQYSKEEFISILKDNGIIGLGGAGFPTYVKYENTKIKTLIINAVECEPYITADYALAVLKCEEILETIDAILEINHIAEAIIVIKENNVNLKKVFDNYIGTYLKIKLKCIKNYYPAGWEKNIIKDITGKEYEILPNEVGVAVNNISTIYAIYEALKYNKPLIERIVTFTGPNLMQCKNVLVKIGTSVKDILNELEVKNEGIIISGGPMMGNLVDKELVISANQNCILLMTLQNNKTTECIKCGKCVNVCPAQLSPVLIMKNVKKNNKNSNELKQFQPQRCVECGLCSYICPAKIDVRGTIKEAKKIVRGDK